MGDTDIQRFPCIKQQLQVLLQEHQRKERNSTRRNYLLRNARSASNPASSTSLTRSGTIAWSRSNWPARASESQSSVLCARRWYRPRVPRKHSQTGHWSLVQVVPSLIIRLVCRDWNWQRNHDRRDWLQISQRLSTPGPRWGYNHLLLQGNGLLEDLSMANWKARFPE